MAVTISGSTPTFSVATGYAGGTITQPSAVTASGTSVTFTGIPSWAKRITVMFSGVAGTSSTAPFIRLGTSGGVVSTGYLSYIQYGTSGGSSTVGFNTAGSYSAGNQQTGQLVITNITGNTWVATGLFTVNSLAVNQTYTMGSLALGGTLDRVSITFSSGTDTFNAGTINILYE